MSIGSKEGDEEADEVGDGHNQLKELIEGQHLQNIKAHNHMWREKLNLQVKNAIKNVSLNLCI